MRILVTGGAGFIGSNLAGDLYSAGHEVVVADDFSSAHWQNLVSLPAEIVTVDVADSASRLGQIAPCEVIFHEASITDTTVTDQRKMIHNNVEGFRRILELAGQWKSRLVWASSASIYGRAPSPMKEGAQPDPLNVYAYSKLAMERLAEGYREKSSQPIIGLRYFNVYGPGEDHKGKFASMIHQLARQMRQGKRPRVFVAGEQRRDFVYIADVIQANIKAMTSQESGVFNVGSGGSYSFNDVITQLNRVLQTKLEPDYFLNPYSFTQDWTEADLSAAAQALGYLPEFDLAGGVAAYHATGMLGVSI